MAKKSKVEIEIKSKGGPSLKKSTQEINKQKKAIDKLGKSEKKRNQQREAQYTRQKQGVVQTANSTKNFSKLQQSVDGGGAGGLVRAYALLAANVFALSAAFGVLSRSAQVDTLLESMKQLEVVSGNSVRAVARDLQVASGFGLDFADAMRSTSLALSAGFDASAITELGEVARNAAVSLGRPMGDALDRIFRGVIKVEPELLDEIGLFVRVKEAAAKYASDLGIAASELTEFQKRQAFANEAIQQGKDKFEAFKDVKTDPYSQLAAAFSDIAQSFTSVLNSVVGPLLQTLAGSKQLMTALFIGISVALLSKAVPALGLFAKTQSQNAADNAKNHQKYIEALDTEGSRTRKNAIEKRKLAQQEIQDNIKKIESKTATGFGGAKRSSADRELKLARKTNDLEGQKVAILKRKGALNTSYNRAKGKNKKLIDSERIANEKILKQLDKAITKEKEILRIRKEQARAGVQSGSFAGMKKQKLATADVTSSALLGVVGTAETKGTSAAWKDLTKKTKGYAVGVSLAGGKATAAGKSMFFLKGALGIAGTAFSKFMMKMQGALIVLSMLAPILGILLKRWGLWDAQSKKVNESIDKTKKGVEILNDKLEHNAAVIKDAANFGSTKYAEANLAMSRTLRDTTENLIKQREEFDQWKANATSLALAWDSLQRTFGAGMEANIEELETSAIDSMIKNFDDLPGSVQQLTEATSGFARHGETTLRQQRETVRLNGIIAKGTETKAAAEAALAELGNNMNYAVQTRISLNDTIAKSTDVIAEAEGKRNDIQEKANESRGKLVAQLKEQFGWTESINKETARLAVGQETLLSIATGARDVARDFADQYISSTDADKPLAIFEQISGNILTNNEKMKVSDEDRANFLEAIANEENAIATLMSKEALDRFKATKDEGVRLKILEDQKKEFKEQQRLLTMQKNELKQIASLTKHIKTISKQTSLLSALELDLEDKKLSYAVDMAGIEKDNLARTKDINVITFDTIHALEKTGAAEEVINNILDAQGISKTDYLQMKNKEMDITEANMNLTIARATKEEKLLANIAKIMKTRIDAQEKLNKAITTNIKLQAQLDKFTRTGTTKLNPVEEAYLMIEAEQRRLELAKEKAKIEKAIIIAQFAIIKATLASLEAQNVFLDYNLEQIEKHGKDAQLINPDMINNDLDSAATTLTNAVDIGLSNSTKKFAVEFRTAVEEALKSSFSTDIMNVQDTNISKMLDKLDMADLFGKKLKKDMTAQWALVWEGIQKKSTLSVQLDNQSITDMRGIQELFEITAELEKLREAYHNLSTQNVRNEIGKFTIVLMGFADAVKDLGTGGTLAATIAEFSVAFVQGLQNMKLAIDDLIRRGQLDTDNPMHLEDFKVKNETVAEKLNMAANAFSGLSSIMSAASANRVAGIDREIAAEKKRDGKSKESLAKIAALEKKKEKMERKAFNMKKKMLIAQAIMSTAAAVMSTMEKGGFWVSPLAMFVAAMGAAQVAIISGMSYQGGGSADVGAGIPAEISVGERSNKVDVTKGASSGELAYLRGERGIGTSATNFTPTGGASGLRKGYANGGEILVGEQGPEVITPLSPMQVWPSGAGAKSQINANFTIHAIDAQGVEEVLLGQQGNIINMIRSAANDYGEEFLEDINTDTYGEATGGGG